MQTSKKIKPALLDNQEQPKIYQVRVDLGNKRWAQLNYSDKEFAVAEYNRIKAASIYCACWVNSIILEEIKDETMA